MNIKELVASNKVDFLNFMKSKFRLIHNSNVFFRDLHFGLMAYLVEKEGRKVSYTKGETLALELSMELEREGIFNKIDHQSWKLNYPEFILPRVEKKVH